MMWRISVLAFLTLSLGIAADGPASFPAIAQRGVALAKTGHCAEALPLLHKAQGHIGGAELKRDLGTAGVNCAMSLDRQDDALHFIEFLNREFPGDPAILYLTTHVFSDLSIRASQKLIYTAPSSPQVHQLNAEALETQGKWKEAADEYRAVLKKDPDMPGIHYRIGRLILSQPQTDTTFADARKEFEAELKIDPSNAGAEYVLGELARQEEKWPQAIDHFSRATKLDARFADAFMGLGRSLTSAGQAAKAIAPLETAEKLQPANPETHFYLATAYMRAGRKADSDREIALHKETTEKAGQKKDEIRSGVGGPQPIERPKQEP